MNKIFWVLIGIIVISICSTISSYNSIINADETAQSSWGNLQSTLQRRLDLIPNLVETVKAYTNHESETLQKVVEARAQATSIKIDSSVLNDPKAMKKFMEVQGELSAGISRLLAVSENYPNLKASDSFRDLMSQLEGTENRINVARQNFNDSVKIFNLTIRRFPNSIINKQFLQLPEKNFFAADQEAQHGVKVNFSK